jgi:cysteine sulfinate desulfinase/cysteine desulfurase-like protein
LTGDPKPSKILQAIGLGPDWTSGGLRLTVGRQNDAKDVERVIKELRTIVPKLSQPVVNIG